MKEKLSIYMYFELQRTPFGLGRVKERKEKFSSVFFYLHFVFITFESSLPENKRQAEGGGRKDVEKDGGRIGGHSSSL